MNKKWDHNVPSVEIWQEALRILKPGAYLLCACGTRTYHRMVTNIEDAGFNIRDTIVWCYGSGFPKSLNISKAIDKYPSSDLAKQYDGYGTSLKPAVELFCLAQKPISEKNYAQNVIKWGTGGINVDGCRIEAEPWKPHYASGLAKDKFFWNGEPTYYMHQPHNLGRFPANLIHDGSQEVLDLFPNTKNTTKYHNNNTPNNTNRDNAIQFSKEKHQFNYGQEDNTSAARFFYSTKSDVCFMCERQIKEDTNRCLKHANYATPTIIHSTQLNDSAQKVAQGNTQQNKEDNKQNKPINANIAENYTKITNQTNQTFAQKNATQNIKEFLDQNVKYAANLCKECEIDFVQKVVEIKNSGSSPQKLQATQGFITNYKNFILIQNLARCAKNQDNIDTTKTIQNLLKLFGSANLATTPYTKETTKSELKRLIYTPKASKRERNEGLEGITNIHPTVKPLQLMKYLCRLITPPNGSVLDPFMGSGTTGVAAILEGFQFIGCEIDTHYFNIAQQRINHTQQHQLKYQQSSYSRDR